ncbi:Bromodomain [Penicillium macrosclerotiorum]|uniref:Bromodomain n=1 Tax=Penicillium macrosclerotiorum TaxID=303699 RepID=UPI00254737AF|nr:Bromodomain [Penicillium macrosclerotiorum]KAJ5692093.1 Bromodomain [Penicillium macrosclerotiorum]
MESEEREMSQPQAEEPVDSIEDDGAISEDQWKSMMDVIMAIYDFREQDGHDPSRLFHRSVNKRLVPDYHEIIKEPMALSILKQKFNKREYKQFSDFVRDCALIPHNAQTYNRPKSQAYEDALVIKDVFIAEFKKLAEQGIISAEEAELPDLGEIPEADPLPDEDEDDEEEEEDDEEDSDDEGRRKKKPGPKPGGKRGAQKSEPDNRKRRGRPPRVDTPMETRIKTILKGIRKFKGPNGQLKIIHFERLPDKIAYPDYYMEIKEPIAIDIIKRKSKRKKYNSVDHFMRDLDLMFNNAKAYNQSESQIYKDAVDLQNEAHKLAEQEKKKPDSEYLMEDGRFPLPDGILHRNELWKVGDWVHVQNPNDVSKPIVAQIYRTWQDSDGEKWINACWYYRPEQTVHHFEKHFYPNEVVKTGQYRDHRVEEIVDRCFVMFFTRYSRGRPRDLAPDKEIYVCEARYNEEKHKLNKIKTWASCLPDEVREKDYEMDLFDVPRKIKKVPSPIKHLLKDDAKETDDLPRPTWGTDNAPPVVGAVHRRPRDENESPPPEPTPSPPPPSLPPQPVPSATPRQSISQPLPHTAMGSAGNAATAQLQAPSPAVPMAQASPVTVPQVPYQAQINPQMYQGPSQRRPSNFVPPTPTGGYQVSPAAPPYTAIPQSPYANYPTNRLQATASVYNPNAPRPIEVYHLNDSANNAIPEDIRAQFHTDAMGHVLFFSAPPLDIIPLSQQKLGHSLKYLASKEEHQKKVAERKRKKEGEQRERDEAAKRQRAAEEAALAGRIKALAPKAIECMVQQVVGGTEELYKAIHQDQAQSIWAADNLAREKRAQADRLARQETEQIQAQSRNEGFVSLKGSAMYLGDT